MRHKGPGRVPQVGVCRPHINKQVKQEEQGWREWKVRACDRMTRTAGPMPSNQPPGDSHLHFQLSFLSSGLSYKEAMTDGA